MTEERPLGHSYDTTITHHTCLAEDAKVGNMEPTKTLRPEGEVRERKKS